MRNNARLFEGLSLIAVGVVLLLNMLGTVPWSVWANVLHYWPIFLIIGGVAVVFRQRVPFIGLLATVLVIVVLLSVYAPNLPGFNGFDGFFGFHITAGLKHTGASGAVAPEAAGQRLSATLQFGAADLDIDGDTTQAYEASIDYRNLEPVISSSSNATGTELSIQEPRQSVVSQPNSKWEVSLNPDLPLSLTVNSGACDAELDLQRNRLTDLNISAGAGQYTIKIGDRSPSVSVQINAAATEVRLTVPASAGLRMRASGVLMDTNFAAIGLVRSGDAWVSPGFDNAAQKIDAQFNGAVGSIHIDR